MTEFVKEEYDEMLNGAGISYTALAHIIATLDKIRARKSPEKEGRRLLKKGADVYQKGDTFIKNNTHHEYGRELWGKPHVNGNLPAFRRCIIARDIVPEPDPTPEEIEREKIERKEIMAAFSVKYRDKEPYQVSPERLFIDGWKAAKGIKQQLRPAPGC